MKALRILTGILLAVIALNAFGGGYYAMAGAENVPLEWLANSPFTSYFIPGLFLFAVVGGCCTVGAIALFRKHKYANYISLFCALLLMSWILIQVGTIGYVSPLQPAVFIAAVLIAILASILHIRKA